MVTNILDAYGEDGDFAYMNGNVGGGITVETTAAGNFRSGFARCAINIIGDNGSVYSQAFAVTTGNFDILTLVTNLRATQGAGSLTHIALAQEISGTQYVTSPQNFPTAFGPVQFIQETNPATGQLWTQSDINAGGFQSGYKATT